MSDKARRPIRVVLVGPSMDIVGGQAVQVQRLLRRLAELDGIEVEFLPVNPRLPLLRGLQRIKYVRTVVTSMMYWFSLLWRVPSFDVVHAFSASYSSYLLAPLPAMIVGRMYGKKVVLNYRSGEAEDHLSRFPFARRTMKLAHEIVVPSDYLVDVFGRFGFHARSIHNFVEMDGIAYRERHPLKPNILSNRNLEPLYNVGCALRAFGQLQREVPEAQLTIVGDGAQRKELELLAQTLGLKQVSFAGLIPPQRMREFYDAADLYLNTPNIDNMPNSVIEAYASGLAVVTTNAGGIPYIVRHGETGLMSECNDHESLARDMLALLRDPRRAAGVTERARHEALTKYVWQAVAGSWAELYRGLVSGQAGVATTPSAVVARSREPN